MKILLVLSGPIAVGKSKFVQALSDLVGAKRISTSQWLKANGCPDQREALQAEGARRDEETGGAWIVDVVKSQLGNDDDVLVLDAARLEGQVTALAEAFPERVFHIHLTASDETLAKRYSARDSDRLEFATYAEAKAHPTEAAVPSLRSKADLVLDTDHTDPENLAQAALRYFDIPVEQGGGMVDVIVGGQYGSEGKGNVCAAIAQYYDVLVRIGGPNAGHKVADPKYNYVQLPSGTGSNAQARILIGAGSTLSLPQLLKEMMDHKLTPARLMIDAQAMIIDDEDVRAEASALHAISSTGQGVGAATARKIANRGNSAMFGPPVRLARDVKQLKDFVGDVRAELDRSYRAGKKILLEGTQGTALSIHHGIYPSVTSRETSVSGCLADAGIAWSRVRKVIMVVRTYPIRVGNPPALTEIGDSETGLTSGWMGRELEFEEVANRSGIPAAEIRKTEMGSVSNKQRRIAEFDWGQLCRTAAINGPTDIAVTFADYLGIANRDAASTADLNQRAKDFIVRVERVTGATVSLVSTKFAKDGVLGREGWS